MSIKKLFFETTILLTTITILVVILNSLQVQFIASQDLSSLQKQYIDATYEIYKNEIIGDILVGSENITQYLLNEITSSRKVGVILTYEKNTLISGKYTSQMPILSYNVNLGNKKFAILKLYPLENFNSFDFIPRLLLSLTLEIFVLGCGFYYLMRKMKRCLLNPLNEISFNLDSNNIMYFTPKKETVAELKQLCSILQRMNAEIEQKVRYEAESKAAKQVAHDIRSPLACLNLLLSYTEKLPEKQRALMRSSIQRITDIANTLQSKAKKIDVLANQNIENEHVMISPMIESLVTEKRIQLGLTTSIQINLFLEKGYSLFSIINPVEFRRAISNLIDNSLEAFTENTHQKINIFIHSHEDKIILNIEDNGSGIPNEILDKIGTYGFSFGKSTLKSSGNGLGVYHAISTMQAAGGSLTIDSALNQGTKITITLPQAIPPAWFISDITLHNTRLIIILDDDQSIHDLWKEKFAQHSDRKNFKMMHFTDINNFSNFLLKKKLFLDKNAEKQPILFLMDYEIIGQTTNGLDLIEKFNLNYHAILITSHHDEIAIQKRAISLNVSILPKSVVPYISLLWKI